MEKVEKVVNPPNNPIIIATLKFSPTKPLSNKLMTRPIKKDPNKLTVIVPIGKWE
jgi:hypothetical protein